MPHKRALYALLQHCLMSLRIGVKKCQCPKCKVFPDICLKTLHFYKWENAIQPLCGGVFPFVQWTLINKPFRYVLKSYWEGFFQD
jgi:hypothetical protein